MADGSARIKCGATRLGGNGGWIGAHPVGAHDDGARNLVDEGARNLVLVGLPQIKLCY